MSYHKMLLTALLNCGGVFKTAITLCITCSSTLLQDINGVRRPLEYFMQYFLEDFYELASECTNLYYFSSKGKHLRTSPQEIKKLFGMHIIMGCVKYPRVRMYWQRGFRLPVIADAMPRDRFFTLRMSLHVVNTIDVSEDTMKNRLWKVQPIIDVVRGMCLKLPRPTGGDYSIDEQMVPFTGRCSLVQYVPNKPRPRGLKNFVLATSQGLVLDFELYQGKSTPLPDTVLGCGPAVILRLSENLPQDSRLYFDRYFTTLPLLETLSNRGLEATGTLMRNRVRDIHLSDDRKLKRGDMEEFCREDNKVVVVQWKDSKAVTLASTCTGCEPVENVQRWSKAEKKYVTVSCPAVVRRYNQCMGGVDVCDQLMEAYRTFIKTRKWTLKVIIHMLDLVCVNSWLQYRVDCKNSEVPRKDILQLLDFRMSIGEALISSPKGKPYEESDESDANEIPSKRYRPASTPCKDKRLDNFAHWPTVDNLRNARNCRRKECNKRTRTRCKKCNVYLCLSKDADCFETFHTDK